MNYEEQLTDPNWLLRRQQILERDWHMCQVCMSSKNLNVHHKQYIKGRMAWEYSDWYLITMCGKCHKEWHERNEIKVTENGDGIVEGFDRIKRFLGDLQKANKNG